MRGLGISTRHIARSRRQTGIWPYDTVRRHCPEDPSSRVYAEQIERFQAALRLAGHRDHAEEDADFGVPSDDKLHYLYAGSDADDRARCHDDPYRRA